MTPEMIIITSGGLVVALAFGLRYIDRRIDARIEARVETDKQIADLHWWESQGEKARRQLVEIHPELLKREEVARWAAGHFS